MSANQRGKVLVVRGGAIGDFILTLPSLRLIRENLPDAEIEILGYPPAIDLAPHFDLAHRTRSFEYGAMAAFFVPNGKLPQDLVNYFASFEVIVSYLYDSDGYFEENIDRCSGATFLQGIHKIDETADAHASVQLAKPLEQLALFLDEPNSVFATPPPERARRIAIHPGSGSAKKNWGFENWFAFVQRLRVEQPDHELLVLSGEAEHGIIGEFVAMLEGAAIPHTHLQQRPLTELADVLRECAVFVGHDTGSSHLAAAAGTPSVLLFGPTEPKIWAPKSQGVIVVRDESRRMDAIQIDHVANAVRRSVLEG